MTLESEYPGKVFPTSFTLLYCPLKECSIEVPFKDTDRLLEHLQSHHDYSIECPQAVLPFLDRYLERRCSADYIPSQDAQIRKELQAERLAEILKTQERERKTSHEKGRHCIFCPLYCANKLDLFTHMYTKHNFNIGLLDNLVYVDEFLTALQNIVDHHHCLFCTKHFPNGTILKKHMKNKGHFKIDPKDHRWDRFYIVNYLMVGKLASQTEDDGGGEGESKGKHHQRSITTETRETDEEDDWSQIDESLDERTMCLFCPCTLDRPELIIQHMRSQHSFDWPALTLTLNTHEKIKLTNYIRYNEAQSLCIYGCTSQTTDEQEENKFGDAVPKASAPKCNLEDHRPFGIPDRSLWDTSRFLFPTFEDDPFLLFIDQFDEDAM